MSDSYPMDCSSAGSSIHGISQTRILEWVAISFFRGSSPPRNQICMSFVSCIVDGLLHCRQMGFTSRAPGKAKHGETCRHRNDCHEERHFYTHKSLETGMLVHMGKHQWELGGRTSKRKAWARGFIAVFLERNR